MYEEKGYLQRVQNCVRNNAKKSYSVCCPKVPSNNLIILPQQNHWGALCFLTKPLLCALLSTKEKDAVLNA